ncbi:glycine zipper 2TM domain-containing protein [Arenimonas fontis]|uniref:Glycine zipper 2TM domain-containing protein n=1 Tax=Arenimonas fontis TaxID=2608255 RepID=A0A5B2ZBB8_9GAMM|nr:glycine zipper 2TM domain-containing protein [Arenimonas fontis]KAA2284451.1 glycine zipper 2TM domain-containing protein [Arenimonas fontis]
MQYKFLIAAGIAAMLAACASSTPRDRGHGGYGYGRDPGHYEPRRCYDCGQVERIVTVYGARDNTRTGAILGGVIGAVAAREIPKHGSKGKENTATVAGAVAGAAIGNAIENKANEESFDIHVRMDDGRLLVINRNSLGNGVRVGARVRVDGTRLIPIGY